MTVVAKPPPDERRKHLRNGTLWHGELRTPKGIIACRVLNLSVRGATVEVDGAVAPGQSVTLISRISRA